MTPVLKPQDFERLKTALDELDGSVLVQSDALKALGVKFRGTLAEACILTKHAQGVVELNALSRMQMARVLNELDTLDEHLRMMIAALFCEVADG